MAAAPKPGPSAAPGSQPPPAPTGTPEPTIVAAPAPSPTPTPEAARRAEQAEVHGDTRAQLSALRTQADAEIHDFSALVREGSSDFAGSDSAETLEQNPAFAKVMAGLREMLQDPELEGIPTNFTGAWMKAITQFMLAEIRSYGPSWKFWQTWGKMGIEEAALAVQNAKNPIAVGRSGLHGVGKFEDWIASSPLAQEFETWQSEEEQQEEVAAQDTREAEVAAAEAQVQTATLTVERDRVTAHANQLLTFLGALSMTVVPPQLRTKIEGLKTKAGEASVATALTSIDAELTTLDTEVAKFEALDGVAKDINAPEREAILTAVRDGKKTPEVAKTELEQLKQSKQQGVVAAARGETPMIDSWMEQLEEFDPGDEDAWYGKLFSMGKQLMAAVLGIVTTIVAKNAFARRWVVGEWGLVSNERLEKLGDVRAALAVKTEHEFAQFGIPTKYANILGERKARDVIGMIRTPARLTKLAPETASDATLSARFAQLASQLEAKNGGTSEEKLFNFIGKNDQWANIQYGAAGAATATAPAPAQQAAPETPQAKVAKMFEGMTPDDQAALKTAKVKDVAAGTLPTALAQNDRAKKIAAKITANGGATAAAELTVDQFLQDSTNASKDWAIT